MTENTAVFGLDAFDTTAAAEEGAVMEVRSPATGEVMYWPDGRPWTITYYGADSERVLKASRQQNDRRSQMVMRTRAPVGSVMVEKDNIELLVAATKSWDMPLGDGTPAANDPKEYRSAYTKYKWLYEQGEAFSGTRANFLKSAQKA
jgi:hypothetical protein